MLTYARAKLRVFRHRAGLVQQTASDLPFNDGIFDAVSCLESLEFFPKFGKKSLLNLFRFIGEEEFGIPQIFWSYFESDLILKL